MLACNHTLNESKVNEMTRERPPGWSCAKCGEMVGSEHHCQLAIDPQYKDGIEPMTSEQLIAEYLREIESLRAEVERLTHIGATVLAGEALAKSEIDGAKLQLTILRLQLKESRTEVGDLKAEMEDLKSELAAVTARARASHARAETSDLQFDALKKLLDDDYCTCTLVNKGETDYTKHTEKCEYNILMSQVHITNDGCTVCGAMFCSKHQPSR